MAPVMELSRRNGASSERDRGLSDQRDQSREVRHSGHSLDSRWSSYGLERSTNKVPTVLAVHRLTGLDTIHLERPAKPLDRLSPEMSLSMLFRRTSNDMPLFQKITHLFFLKPSVS